MVRRGWVHTRPKPSANSARCPDSMKGVCATGGRRLGAPQSRQTGELEGERDVLGAKEIVDADRWPFCFAHSALALFLVYLDKTALKRKTKNQTGY